MYDLIIKHNILYKIYILSNLKVLHLLHDESSKYIYLPLQTKARYGFSYFKNKNT